MLLFTLISTLAFNSVTYCTDKPLYLFFLLGIILIFLFLIVKFFIYIKSLLDRPITSIISTIITFFIMILIIYIEVFVLSFLDISFVKLLTVNLLDTTNLIIASFLFFLNAFTSRYIKLLLTDKIIYLCFGKYDSVSSKFSLNFYLTTISVWIFYLYINYTINITDIDYTTLVIIFYTLCNLSNLDLINFDELTGKHIIGNVKEHGTYNISNNDTSNTFVMKNNQGGPSTQGNQSGFPAQDNQSGSSTQGNQSGFPAQGNQGGPSAQGGPSGQGNQTMLIPRTNRTVNPFLRNPYNLPVTNNWGITGDQSVPITNRGVSGNQIVPSTQNNQLPIFYQPSQPHRLPQFNPLSRLYLQPQPSLNPFYQEYQPNRQVQPNQLTQINQQLQPNQQVQPNQLTQINQQLQPNQQVQHNQLNQIYQQFQHNQLPQFNPFSRFFIPNEYNQSVTVNQHNQNITENQYNQNITENQYNQGVVVNQVENTFNPKMHDYMFKKYGFEVLYTETKINIPRSVLIVSNTNPTVSFMECEDINAYQTTSTSYDLSMRFIANCPGTPANHTLDAIRIGMFNLDFLKEINSECVSYSNLSRRKALVRLLEAWEDGFLNGNLSAEDKLIKSELKKIITYLKRPI